MPNIKPNDTILSIPPLNTDIWDNSGRTFQQRFSVEFSFPVCFTRDIFGKDNKTLFEIVEGQSQRRRSHRLAFVLDEGVAREMPDLARRIAAYVDAWPELSLAGPVDTIVGGEAAKNDPALVVSLQQRFVSLGLDRHSYVVCVGGGAVLDLVGYAAATTHRGIRHIRIPTTVLAQNDSGVGVKNGGCSACDR